ncbi:MAG: NAD(P)/FAD-dependent oxidoreductase [Haloferacaceae archaeon]
MSARPVAVVGGGIAGASVAYHLAARTDRPVVVYERGALAGETTARSAAFFGFYGSDLERRLKRYGMALYNDLLAAPRSDAYHDLVGRLRVATTPDGAARLEERRDATPDDAMLTYRPGAALPERVFCPELDADSVAGATYRPQVGYHRPQALARELGTRAREAGVTVETGTPVTDVVVEDDRVRELVVDGERRSEAVDVAAVVCAAGPWNPSVCRLAGLDPPVSHSRAPVLELERPAPATHTLPIVSHVGTGVYARGHGDDAVLVGHYPGSPDAEAEYDPDAVADRVGTERREEMRAVLADLLPPLADAPVRDEWVGVRSHTPDGHPIAGWTGIEGLSIVAFDSSGIQLSPALGRLVATQLVDGTPTDEHDALSITRFDGYGEQRLSLDEV